MIMTPNFKNTKERTHNELYSKHENLANLTITLIAGIDIAKDKHVARAQDHRGIEFGKRLFFENRIHGFENLLDRVKKHQQENDKTHVIFGVEPTGHFWLSLSYFLTAKGYDFVPVNPMHKQGLTSVEEND